MNRLIAAALLFACLHGTSAADEPAPKPRQLIFTLRMCQGDPLGDEARGTLKTLARPTVVTQEQRAFSFASGGEAAAPSVDGGIQKVFVGTSLEGKPGTIKDGKVPVDLALSVTTADGAEDGEARFATEKVHVISTLKLGELKRIRLRKDGDRHTWLEITVEDVHHVATERTAKTVIASPLYAR